MSHSASGNRPIGCKTTTTFPQFRSSVCVCPEPVLANGHHQVLKGRKWSKHTSGAMFFQAFIITIRERSSCSMVSSGDFALRKTALSFQCFVPSSRACVGKRILNLAFKK
jgi:hypothetical protein